MFRKLYEKIEEVRTEVVCVLYEFRSFKDLFHRMAGESQRRAESIETWMELAVDTKADEIAERFTVLLKERSKQGKVPYSELEELVRQAAKGQ